MAASDIEEPLPFRAVYVTSHVGPHPMHRALVKGVHADIGRTDRWLRSVDRPRPKWQQYLSWLVNGWAFDNRDLYDLFVLEGFQIPAILMKWMRRIAPRQKVVCHHVGEQLYFLQTGFYSKSTDWGMRRIIEGYDAHICVGREQTRLLTDLLGPGKGHVYNVYCTHVSEDKYRRFVRLSPGLESRRVLFVGNIYGDWRTHYKGVDLVLEGFHRALALDQKEPSLGLTLIGARDEDVRRLTAGRYPQPTLDRIQVIPFAQDLGPHFESHSLFLLPARGDAFPTVVLEAMAGGMIPMVSEATGNKEVVAEVAPELVVPLDADEIARRVRWFLELPPAARAALSARARQLAGRFTEEQGVSRFREALLQIHRDLGVGRSVESGRSPAADHSGSR